MHHLRADFAEVWFSGPPGENEPSSGRGTAFSRNPQPAGASLVSAVANPPADQTCVPRGGGAFQPPAPNIFLIGGDKQIFRPLPADTLARARLFLRILNRHLSMYYKEDAAFNLMHTPLSLKPSKRELLRFLPAGVRSRPPCFATPSLWRGSERQCRLFNSDMC